MRKRTIVLYGTGKILFTLRWLFMGILFVVFLKVSFSPSQTTAKTAKNHG